MNQVNVDNPASSSGPKFLASPGATKRSSKQQENNLLELTEYDKFMLINRSKTVDDLIEAVKLLEKNGGISSNYSYGPGELIDKIMKCYKQEWTFNCITRTYGIRQQLMYIMYYEGRIHLL